MENSADIWYFNTSKDFRIKLHPQEIAKGKGFYQSIHQHRYLTTRSIIKDILCQYITLPPSHTWVFSENQYGKPFLPFHPNLHFNWSHSGDDGLLMVSRNHPVGIDIEHERPIEYLDIAKILYSKEEQTFLQQLSPKELSYHFFRIWSQKEAFIKAIGMGLSYPTQEFTSVLHQQTGQILTHHQITHFMVKDHCHGAYCHRVGAFKIQWLNH